MTQTIVVADDSVTMRRIAEMAFKGSPFRVVSVENAEEALQAAYEHRPAVVVLDYHLPDRKGVDACRALKQDPNLRDIPVLLIGGTFHPFDEGEARAAGANDVLVKPYMTDDIVSKVSALADTTADARSRATSPGLRKPQAPAAPAAPAGGLGVSRSGSRPGLGQPRQAPPAPATPAAPRGRTAPAPQRPQSHTRPQAPAAPQAAPRSRFGSPSGSSMKPAAPAAPKAPAPPAAPAGRRFGAAPPPKKTPDVGVRQTDLSEATPIPGPPPTAAALPISKEEIEALVKAEVQRAVREQMLGMVKTVLGDLFKERMLPKLLKYGQDRIEQVVAQDLYRIMHQRVEEMLAQMEE